MTLPKWVRLPSQWIEESGLKEFRWGAGIGSNNLAALMTLAVIAHHSDAETGLARITYDALEKATSLSRSKVAGGLAVLADRGIITRMPEGRSSYALNGFDRAGGWCMLPAKRLYSGGRVEAFKDFRLRSATELNALKLYFLFAARRGRDTNMANISFDKITEYTGVPRERIKAATSLLATTSLAYIERTPSKRNDYGVANAYRLAGLDSHNHMGTKGRSFDAVEFDWKAPIE
ncbi:hypothetical protein [Aquibium microcysteis]|uniref:hypothetical protein n=1 Tax=Aquibium microcysteis TaxID=675281 RepID=UPI00165CF408|nr:hypothetical protein [Aquibium microcysteis]